jgi:16S rRNA (guanine966-N2)-methyltransferase
VYVIIRVIAGSAGGLRLKIPKGSITRPTADRVKEALFGIIGEKVRNALVLDLFAGTGSLGIESLSRGARGAVFVDKNRNCGNIIKENLEYTGFMDRSKIIIGDVLKAINKIKSNYKKYDIIFIDPPYGKKNIDKTLKIFSYNDIIDKNGIIIAESHVNDKMPEKVGEFKLVDIRKYGITALSFYITVKEEKVRK